MNSKKDDESRRVNVRKYLQEKQEREEGALLKARKEDSKRIFNVLIRGLENIRSLERKLGGEVTIKISPIETYRVEVKNALYYYKEYSSFEDLYYELLNGFVLISFEVE